MIWASAEADAWARDFGYSDYLRVCDVRGTLPVCEKAYEMFCAAFECQFERDENAEERSTIQGHELGTGLESTGVVPERKEA